MILKCFLLDLVVHACKLNVQEAEAGRLLEVQDQSVLLSETLSQTKKIK